MIRHTMVIIMKKPDHVTALATERKDEANTVAVARFEKVARLIAFARIDKGKTSEEIVHVAGPMPILKNPKYRASPTIAATSFASAGMKLIATIKNEIAMPIRDVNTKGLLPLSIRRPAMNMTPNLTNPKPSNIHI